MNDTKASLTAARLRALNAVFEEGSFAAAARLLGASQPAISQSVHDLEKAFQVKLFEKRGRRMVPTDLCIEISPLLEQMECIEEQLIQTLRGRTYLNNGLLKIGIGSLMPAMSIIGKFQKNYPDVQVQVEYGIYAKVIDSVLERKVDIGILPNIPKDGRFRRKKCLYQKIVALVPESHHFAQFEQLELSKLAQERLIFLTPGSASQKLIDNAFQNLKLSPKPSLILNTHSEVFEAVTSGLGIGFIWCKGTNRKDGAKRIPIVELDYGYEEEIFCRSDTSFGLVNIFFGLDYGNIEDGL